MCIRLVKIHGFSKCLSVLYKKNKNHLGYMEKKKISSLYGDETIIVYMVYMEENFFFHFFFCPILTKIKGVYIFISIPHVTMGYFLHHILLFILNKALVVIVWINLDTNSVEY